MSKIWKQFNKKHFEFTIYMEISHNNLLIIDSKISKQLRKVSDRLSLGAEYEINEQKTSSCRLAYEYLFRNGRVQGALDTAGQVSCVVQDFMGFGLSGMIDYVNDQYKFGFMMHMMPPPEDQPAP